MGKVGGCVVFLIDFGKGLLASLIALWICQWFELNAPLNLGAYQVMLALSFFGCVEGHIYSPWLHFKGGKGIAVAIGSLFVVFGVIGSLIEIAVFAILVIGTKKVSVGSIASAIVCPFISLYVFWGNWLAWLLMFATVCTVIWAHRSNIQRLMNHEESSIGGGK